MNEMNPRMTEFLAQDRIAGMRDEAAAGHRIAKCSAEPKPTIARRPGYRIPSPVGLVERWLRRAVRT
jgi:hypothetical protein